MPESKLLLESWVCYLLAFSSKKSICDCSFTLYLVYVLVGDSLVNIGCTFGANGVYLVTDR